VPERVEAADCVEGAVREAQRLTCVAQLEADPGGKIELFGKRGRTRHGFVVDLDTDDRTPRPARKPQRRRSPAGSNIQNARVSRDLEHGKETVIVGRGDPDALTEVIVVYLGEDRVLQLPKRTGVTHPIKFGGFQLMIRHRRLGPSIASTMAFGLPPNLISMPSTLQMRSIFASAIGPRQRPPPEQPSVTRRCSAASTENSCSNIKPWRAMRR
jgi:hypothetical protein